MKPKESWDMNNGGKRSIYTKEDQSGARVLSPFRDRLLPLWDGSHDFGTLEGWPGFLSTLWDSPKSVDNFYQVFGTV